MRPANRLWRGQDQDQDRDQDQDQDHGSGQGQNRSRSRSRLAAWSGTDPEDGVDREDRLRLLVAALAIVGLVLLVVVMAKHPEPATTLWNGDELGPQPGETASAYTQRAGESLQVAQDPAFALVSFRAPESAEAAAKVVEGVQRASALLTPAPWTVEVPEPTGAEDRQAVFARGLELDNQAGAPVYGVIVHASGDRLRAVQQRPGVLAVEVLPPDAVWGAFGIRPLRQLELAG